jgi:hypothetical protein
VANELVPLESYRIFYRNVRLVPEAEVNLWILNVGYGESRRSDCIAQGRHVPEADSQNFLLMK